MPTIFCDNDGCMFSNGYGFCDCDKLSIVDCVCEGSMHGGRNASYGDINDRLKVENVRLREMLAECNEELAKMRRVIDYLYSFVKARGVDAEDMRELGVEVDK